VTRPGSARGHENATRTAPWEGERVRVERIGFTPLKGGRHQAHPSVALTAHGPVGDRAFCLVDRATSRVLRTVENPTLVQGKATWDTGVLSVDLPRRSAEGTPVRTGEVLKVDYWGRVVAVEVCDGPWAEAYSDHLGREVVLARATHPGEVVYGAPVSMVTTSSLDALSGRLGRRVGSPRFRATFLLDTGEGEPHAEDTWIGRELRLGQASVLVRGLVPRCTVVDLDPTTGVRDTPVLRTLAGYRRGQGVISFGIDAVVTVAGRVHTGDPVDLERD
jgi:uncharacterized protein